MCEIVIVQTIGPQWGNFLRPRDPFWKCNNKLLESYDSNFDSYAGSCATLNLNITMIIQSI
jgi:hypothetical protein